MIYFCTNGNQDEVKIGYTDSVKNRLQDLQTGTPEALTIVGLMDGTKAKEVSLKNKFSHLCLRGEWYSYSNELRNYILSHCYIGGDLPDTEIRIVDSSLAQRWLEHNSYDKQRKLRRGHVNLLAKEMLDGRFQPTGQVAFAKIGNESVLVNGQHTLHAIVQSGVPQPLNIVIHQVNNRRGIAELYWCYDIHIKRTFGEIVAAFDIPERSGLSRSQVTSVGSAVTFLTYGFKDRHSSMLLPLIDRGELVVEYSEAAKAYYDTIKHADTDIRRKLHRKATMAVALATFQYAVSEYGKEKLVDFWRLVAEDDGLGKQDPRKWAYKHILFTGMPGGVDLISREVQTASYSARFLAHCWNMWTKENEITKPPYIERLGPITINGTPFINSTGK